MDTQANGKSHGTSPRAFAFFDVDQTLVSFKTMHSFMEYYLLNTGRAPRLLGWLRVELARARLRDQRCRGLPREIVNAEFYRAFRGRDVDELQRCAFDWFRSARATVDPFYLRPTLAALRGHQEAGREVALVSGSSVDILAPIAAELGVRHVLATRLRSRHGRFTGEIEPPQVIGAGKAELVRRFLAERGGDGSASFAYGDHESDFPMLSVVGHPVVVTCRPYTYALARERRWLVLHPSEPVPLRAQVVEQ